MGNAANATDITFGAEVLSSDTPVLVDFYAEWCGPCKRLSPTLDEIAAAHAGEMKVVKVDIDNSPQVAQNYGIMSVPTLLFFKNGEVVAQIDGTRSKFVVKKDVANALAA